VGKDYDNEVAVKVRSFVLRYMEAHGAETHSVRAELEQLQTILVDAGRGSPYAELRLNLCRFGT
jgi:hypothetical protein